MDGVSRSEGTCWRARCRAAPSPSGLPSPRPAAGRGLTGALARALPAVSVGIPEKRRDPPAGMGAPTMTEALVQARLQHVADRVRDHSPQHVNQRITKNIDITVEHCIRQGREA